MVRGSQPGQFEHVVLLTLAGLGEEATGGEVYEAMVDATGREVALAAVYITLTRMEGKGWVGVKSEAPPIDRGGKPRRRFSLTRSGAQVLRRMRDEHDRLWAAAQAHSGLGGE